VLTGLTKESKVVLKVCFTIKLEDSITGTLIVIVKHTFVKFSELEKVIFFVNVGVMFKFLPYLFYA